MRTDKSGFLALLGIVMTLLVISILYAISLKVYFKKPEINDKTIKIEGEAAPDINTSSAQSIVQSTRQAIGDIQKQHDAQLDDFMRKGQ